MTPTTTITESTFSASILGARTDSAGAAVTDTTAEEARLWSSILGGGYITPTTAFQVTAQSSPNMTVKVGSGTAKVDHYVVPGTASGQENYVTRLDLSSQNITITAADASQTRTDEIYLVVYDNAYDSTSRVLPRFGYRKGDLGGANPGPDSTWKAYSLLARITVAAGVTSITNSAISDQRSGASLVAALGGNYVVKSLFTTKGDLVVATGASTPARLAVGTDTKIIVADSAQSAGVKWDYPGHSLIGEYTFPDNSAFTVAFAGITQAYKHLQVVIKGSSTSGFGEIFARVNGDTGSHYDSQVIYAADGGAVTSVVALSQTAMQIGIVGATNPSTSEAICADYSVSGATHLFACRSAYLESNGHPTAWSSTCRNWSDTAVISSFTVILGGVGNFSAGTHISLYGLK